MAELRVKISQKILNKPPFPGIHESLDCKTGWEDIVVFLSKYLAFTIYFSFCIARNWNRKQSV